MKKKKIEKLPWCKNHLFKSLINLPYLFNCTLSIKIFKENLKQHHFVGIKNVHEIVLCILRNFK